MTVQPETSLAERLAEAERLMADKAYEPAHALCMEVLAADPQQAGAWFLLGVLAADHDNLGKAAELFGQAAALDLDDPRAPAHLARCLMALNRREEALTQAQAAAGRGPADAATLDILGSVYSRAGLPGRAIGYFEAALAQAPETARFAANLGAARRDIGDLAGAEAAYARALDLDPTLYQAWSSRVRLQVQTAEANFLPVLEAQFAAARSAQAKLHLGHALAKTHEDLGDFETALDWLIRGKAARRREVGYDPRADAELFAAAAATCPTGLRPGPGAPSDQPIFLVGLPGTGAGLVEKILLSHPAVVAAGATNRFAQVLQAMTGASGAVGLDESVLEAARDLDLRRAGQAYLQGFRSPTAGPGRLIDRTLLNVLYAGLICQALPGARIIGLRRHPVAAGLASFRRLFDPGLTAYDYAYDLAHTGAYCAGFEGLMAHWRAVLPADQFTELAYEDLVADPEGQTRRLMAFCGLEGEAPSLTAQVRAQIKAEPTDRWRRYGPGLAPLREALEAAGIGVSDLV